MTIARFARTLDGVNTQATKRDLYNARVLYRRNGYYRVYSAYRDSHFQEKLNEYTGGMDIYLLDKGKDLLTKLYNEGRLTMKKNYTS